MDRQQFTSLFAFLKAVPDPRKKRGRRYVWVCLLAMLCAAVLSGQLSGSAIVDWAINHEAEIISCLEPLLKRIPSGSTLRRVLRIMPIETLQRLVNQFICTLDEQDEVTGTIRGAGGEPLRGQALDGKEVRGAGAHGEDVYLVSLVRHDSGATLAQERVEAGGSEIGTARKLLADRDLAGTVTTMDALHTSQPMAQQIIDQHGHYLMIVKGNQPTLYADIETLFEAQPAAGDDRDNVNYGGKGHGRLEQRTLASSTDLRGYLTFPGAKQVIKRHCTREEVKSGDSSDQVRYAITDLDREQAGAQEIEVLWRGHWTIENKLHYVRDETFGEDRCQIHKDNAPETLATLKNLLLANLRYRGWTNIAAALRYYGASVQQAFAFLMADPY